MKRQEMINLITATIYNNTFRASHLETMPVAEKVLDAIEKAGMLPPADESTKEFWSKKWGYKSYQDLYEKENESRYDGEEQAPPSSWFMRWEE